MSAARCIARVRRGSGSGNTTRSLNSAHSSDHLWGPRPFSQNYGFEVSSVPLISRKPKDHNRRGGIRYLPLGWRAGILTFSQKRCRTSGFKSESCTPCRDPDANVRIRKCALHRSFRPASTDDSPSPPPRERSPRPSLQLPGGSDDNALSFPQGNCFSVAVRSLGYSGLDVN